MKSLWNITDFVMLIYKGYEKLTPIYDNVSGTSKNKLSQYGHQIFNVFSNIANCLWKGVTMSLIIQRHLTMLKKDNERDDKSGYHEPFPESIADIAEYDK